MSAVAVAVVGAASCSREEERLAEEVGRRLAEAEVLVVTGGLGGVMAAACRGARAAGGTTIGLLPGESRAGANPWLTVAIPTGLGEGRNLLVVRAADALVAIGGEYGTLSEIAFALKLGRPVVGLATWALRRHEGAASDPGIRCADEPSGAVALALALGRAAHEAAPGLPP